MYTMCTVQNLQCNNVLCSNVPYVLVLYKHTYIPKMFWQKLWMQRIMLLLDILMDGYLALFFLVCGRIPVPVTNIQIVRYRISGRMVPGTL